MQEIQEYLLDGINFVKRPEYLDLPTSNFNQIFDVFIEKIDADIYVYAHATAPFVSVGTIKECVSAVKSGKYDSAFCIYLYCAFDSLLDYPDHIFLVSIR